MIQGSFRVAMLNILRVGPYDTPNLTGSASHEWLIVERRSPEGTILIISDARPLATSAEVLSPDDLVTGNSIVALLAEPEQANGPGLRFLMVRHLPRGVTTPGTFFPADGCAWLELKGGGLRLQAFGRHAHSRGEVDGVPAMHDIPNPAPSAEGAANWHFDAEAVPPKGAIPTDERKL